MEDKEIIINEEENIEEIEGTEASSGMSPVTGAVIGSALTLAVIAVVKGVKKWKANRKAKKDLQVREHDFVGYASDDETTENSAE